MMAEEKPEITEGDVVEMLKKLTPEARARLVDALASFLAGQLKSQELHAKLRKIS